MTPRLKELMIAHGLHKYVTEECQSRMELLASVLIKEIDAYILEAEGDIDYVRFLMDKHLRDDTVAPRVEPPVSESGEGFESPPVSLTHIAIICPTVSALEARFNEKLLLHKDHIDHYSLSRRFIQIGSVKYSFFISEKSDKLLGHTFDYVILEEQVNLTTQQKSELLSRVITRK